MRACAPRKLKPTRAPARRISMFFRACRHDVCAGAPACAAPARVGRRRARVPRVGPRTVRGGRRRARARAPGRRGARGRDAEPGLAPAGKGTRTGTPLTVQCLAQTQKTVWCFKFMPKKIYIFRIRGLFFLQICSSSTRRVRL